MEQMRIFMRQPAFETFQISGKGQAADGGQPIPLPQGAAVPEYVQLAAEPADGSGKTGSIRPAGDLQIGVSVTRQSGQPAQGDPYILPPQPLLFENGGGLFQRPGILRISGMNLPQRLGQIIEILQAGIRHDVALLFGVSPIIAEKGASFQPGVEYSAKKC